MSITINEKYSGNGGNKQRMFIKDFKIGWKAILTDPNRHLSNGVTQDDFVETFGQKMGGQARRVLDNYLDKWDHKNEYNPNYEAGQPVSRSAVKPAERCDDHSTSEKPFSTRVKSKWPREERCHSSWTNWRTRWRSVLILMNS